MHRLLLMASFGVAGCVTLSDEGRNVSVVSKENRWVLSEHCTLIGDETINNTDGNNSGLTVFEWEIELRNRAAAKGATHLYWEHLPRLNGAINKGYLYRCPDSSETSGLSDSQAK